MVQNLHLALGLLTFGYAPIVSGSDSSCPLSLQRRKPVTGGGLSFGDETACNDSNGLLQWATASPVIDEAMMASVATSMDKWQSPRDLARNLQAVMMWMRPDLQLNFFSAVPVFTDEQQSYIALLGEKNEDIWLNAHEKWWDVLSKDDFFCMGPDRSHISKMEWRGSVLTCPWPNDEKSESFNVSVEDTHGKYLGSIVASNTPKMLQFYQTMTCVRDAFDEPNPKHSWQGGAFSGVFKQLAEWMEWYLMHGMEHFLVYTFTGTDMAVKDVIEPYLKAGVATRIHFQYYPEASLSRFGYASNDCLWRAKNHAKWLLTNVDCDEYLVFPSFANRKMDLGFDRESTGAANISDSLMKLRSDTRRHFDFDYLLNTTIQEMDPKILNPENLHCENPSELVSSLTVQRIRFARGHPNELEISSAQREPAFNPSVQPSKQVVNVDRVYRVAIHKVSNAMYGASMIDVKPEVAMIHHYRLPYGLKVEYTEYDLKDEDANITDDSLALEDVPMLTEALRERFELKNPEDVTDFLKKIVQKRPPTEEEAANMLESSTTTTAESS